MLLIVHLKKQIIETDETKNKILVICTKLSSDIRQIQLERRNEVKKNKYDTQEFYFSFHLFLLFVALNELSIT